jgi:hypothetical protein
MTRKAEVDDYEDMGMSIPEIVEALAERFTYKGIPTRQASNQAKDMVTLAMDDPERFAAIFGETVH